MTEQEKRELKLREQMEQYRLFHAQILDNIQVIQTNSWTLPTDISNAIGSVGEIEKLLTNQVPTQGNHGANLDLIRVLP